MQKYVRPIMLWGIALCAVFGSTSYHEKLPSAQSVPPERIILEVESLAWQPELFGRSYKEAMSEVSADWLALSAADVANAFRSPVANFVPLDEGSMSDHFPEIPRHLRSKVVSEYLKSLPASTSNVGIITRSAPKCSFVHWGYYHYELSVHKDGVDRDWLPLQEADSAIATNYGLVVEMKLEDGSSKREGYSVLRRDENQGWTASVYHTGAPYSSGTLDSVLRYSMGFDSSAPLALTTYIQEYSSTAISPELVWRILSLYKPSSKASAALFCMLYTGPELIFLGRSRDVMYWQRETYVFDDIRRAIEDGFENWTPEPTKEAYEKATANDTLHSETFSETIARFNFMFTGDELVHIYNVVFGLAEETVPTLARQRAEWLPNGADPSTKRSKEILNRWSYSTRSLAAVREELMNALKRVQPDEKR